MSESCRQFLSLSLCIVLFDFDRRVEGFNWWLESQNVPSDFYCCASLSALPTCCQDEGRRLFAFRILDWSCSFQLDVKTHRNCAFQASMCSWLLFDGTIKVTKMSFLLLLGVPVVLGDSTTKFNNGRWLVTALEAPVSLTLLSASNRVSQRGCWGRNHTAYARVGYFCATFCPSDAAHAKRHRGTPIGECCVQQIQLIGKE